MAPPEKTEEEKKAAKREKRKRREARTTAKLKKQALEQGLPPPQKKSKRKKKSSSTPFVLLFPEEKEVGPSRVTTLANYRLVQSLCQTVLDGISPNARTNWNKYSCPELYMFTIITGEW